MCVCVYVGIYKEIALIPNWSMLRFDFDEFNWKIAEINHIPLDEKKN